MRTVIQVASSRLKQNKAKKSLEIIAEDGVQEDVSDNESGSTFKHSVRISVLMSFWCLFT